MQIGSASFVGFTEARDSAQIASQTQKELSERDSTVAALDEPEESDDSGRQSEQKPSDNSQQPRFTEQELEQIQKLEARDLEVRNHEQAHKSAGGQYAGAASYTYQRGPDGINYAVGGEVPIDISPIQGNPEATIQKAETVRRAALAPAEPSAQDRAVAAQAIQIKLEAQSELNKPDTEEETEANSEEETQTAEAAESSEETVAATDTETVNPTSQAATAENNTTSNAEAFTGSTGLSPEDFTNLLASDLARKNALAVFENINAEPPKINLDELV